MALGYIYQAHVVDKTGESGSSEEELAFIHKQVVGCMGKKEILSVLMEGVLATRAYVEEVQRCVDEQLEISAKAIELAFQGRSKLFRALVEVFRQTGCADDYTPFISRWLHAAGL